ncbi:hypothetical protein DFS33DRAFT_1400655 [Desarmillaria ectypa]|nr:hypothetical protein DFS33DRAFT_1400655 [Desarmillaria ectypa]
MLTHTLLIMDSGYPASQNEYNVPAGQSADNSFVTHHSYYANPTQSHSYSNAQNMPYHMGYGGTAHPSASYPGGTANTPLWAPPARTPGIIIAYGLPIFPPPSYPQLYNLPDPASHIRSLVHIPLNAPIHLSSLIDEPIRHSRPGYTIIQLAAVAIYGSRDGRATSGQIRNALMTRWEYFRLNDKALAATLKHALSANALFQRHKPLPTDVGQKGDFWVVDVTNPTGRRARKRNTPSKTDGSTNSDVST